MIKIGKVERVEAFFQVFKDRRDFYFFCFVYRKWKNASTPYTLTILFLIK